MTSRTGRSRALLCALALAAALAPGAAHAQIPGLPPLLPPQDSPPSRPPGALPAPVPGDQATHYRQNAAQTGYSTDDSLFPPLERRWVAKVGGEPGQPLIAGGRVMFVVLSSRGTEVVAVERSRGQTLWRRTLSPGLRNMYIAYGGGRLFAVDASGPIRAIDAGTGNVLWEREFPRENSSFTGPAATDSVVYLHGGRYVRALNAATGSTRWATDTGSDDPSAMAVGSGYVILSHDCDFSGALRQSDGAIVWRLPSECSGGGQIIPAIDRGWAYGMRGGVRLVASGARAPSPLSGYAPDAFTPVSALRKSRYVQSVDRSSGRLLWRFPRGREPSCHSRECWGPVAAGWQVFAIRDAVLHALDARTGRSKWSEKVTFPRVNDQYNQAKELTAGEGLVVLPGPDRITAWSSLLQPPADGSTENTYDGSIVYGGKARLFGAVGRNLRRAGQPRVALQADAFRFGAFTNLATTRTDVDGTFKFTVRPRRNTRYRTVAGRPSAGGTVFVFPKITARFKRGRGRRLNRIVALARIRGPRSVRLRGRRVHLYLVRVRKKRVTRIGSARIRGGRGRGRARIRFKALSRLGRRDYLLYCIRDMAKVGLGPRDLIDRRCGARRLPY